ncbi:asparagine synthetase B [Xylanibacillus composti]|uniref:asparagine synthase (glutamine-hydrolyzing) n=1 Tax=Xylanibacillus composti TaxID=1572762 RepID=A0A8J4M365_9BACL|nr:asparagine synthase-related protein [Xylanibacillus composti]MDT9724522.1 asparagine synthetase B [Xylanibacillus composti]GIQ69785.1 asparagine synthetase B [Xylanibacillus composti]
MSAIAGIVHFHDEPIRPETGGRFMEALQQYPADQSAALCTERAYLGCHAQWTSPESAMEELPLKHRERQIYMTADVILDNREALFDLLQVDRERRNGIGDGELILLAYDKWGTEAPKQLIGEFAFMIWDEKERKLFGARDQTGMRTLFYHFSQGRFAFCTAMPPLFALPWIERRVNERWMAEFLAIPGMMESADLFSTAYEDICQLPPAHTIEIREGRIVCAHYDTLMPRKTLRLRSNEEYEEAFREVLQQAVDARVRTPKKVGATLSGGLDSGTVASFASNTLREQGKRLHTYSFIPVQSFEDWTNRRMIANERPYIEQTVQHIGNVEPQFLDFADRNPYLEIDTWLSMLGIPYKYYENSFWIRGIYERARQDQVGVLLTGARGNFTISWGPAIDYYTHLLKQLRWARLYHELRLYSGYKRIKRTRLLSILVRKAFPLTAFKGKLQEEVVPSLAHPDLEQKYEVLDRIREHELHSGASLDSFDVRRRKFSNLSIANKNGMLSTSLSLRYGVRERDPSGDPRVIRFCLSVPADQFVQHGMDRALIRRATKQYLPDAVRLNQHVRGVQGADWLHRMLPQWPQFVGEIREMLGHDKAAHYMDMARISEALAVFVNPPRPDFASHPSLRLLMRSLIVYRFIRRMD